MRVVISLIILVLLSQMGFGQSIKLSGVVADYKDGKSLPYTSIMILNNAAGTSSDIYGHFELTLPDSMKRDTMIISYVGYESQYIYIHTFNNDTVFLSPQTFNLAEVFVSPAKRKRTTAIINQFNRNDCFVGYSRTPFEDKGTLVVPFRAMEPAIEAMYFAYTPEYKSTPKISEVWVCLKNFKSPPTYSRLRIFNSKKSITPSNDLLTDPIDIVLTENKQLVKVNLEKYNLAFPENGIFVGVELIIIPINSRDIQNNLGDIITIYSPFLNYIPTHEADYKFWLYSQGKWMEKSQSIPNYTKEVINLFYKPAITLVLTD